MPSDKEAEQINRAWWDERAAYHSDTPLYRKHLQKLKSGDVSLLPFEVSEIGDIKGLNVLHLQCHIGTDTLSLSRLGAKVTGVDFSKIAIEQAKRLSADTGIPAEFKQCEIKDIGELFPGQFDLVYTSQGVLNWLPDLDIWAGQIAASLKSGGHLYVSESHPLAWSLAEENAIGKDSLRLGLAYLAQPVVEKFTETGSYADREKDTANNDTVEWSWGLGDIINSLIAGGLELLWLKEHAEGFYQAVPGMVESEDGYWRLPDTLHGKFPLTFTLMAIKP